MSTEAEPVATAAPGIDIALVVEDRRWNEAFDGDLEDLCRECFEAVAAELQLPEDFGTEVSVTFADDAVVKEANAAWRCRDKATNILSFPMPMRPDGLPGPLAGDLLLAFETVFREAGTEKKSFEAHLRHLVVHGFLHLLGHDHIETADAEEMEAIEVRILERFSIANPYAEAAGA